MFAEHDLQEGSFAKTGELSGVRRTAKKVWTSAAAVVPLAVYLPLVIRRYGWSDDFPFLFEQGVTERIVANGRPLLALVRRITFASQDIDALTFTRLVGVIGISAFAVLTAVLLQRWGLSPWFSALLGGSTVLLPAFQTFAGWATTFSFSWVACVGLLAGELWVVSRRPVCRILAMVGMVAGLLVYPPAAFVFWSMLAVRTALLRTPVKAAFGQAIDLVILTVGSSLLALATAASVAHWQGVEFAQRVGLITSPAEAFSKGVWFVTHPLIVAFRPFMISSPSGLEALCTGGVLLLATTIGLALRAPGSAADRLLWSALVLVMLCGAFLAHLVTRGNQIDFRFLVGLSIGGWLLTVIGIRELLGRLVPGLRRFPDQLSSRLGPVVAIVALLLLAGLARTAYRNVGEVFVWPSRTTEAEISRQLATFDAAVHRRVLIVNHYSWWPHKSNLGIFSTRSDLSHGWVEKPLVLLLLSEAGHETSGLVVEVSTSAMTADASTHIVDLRVLRNQL